ncbi:MAG TPA: hypothetical protein VJ440_03845, partial [Candidatus Brocadiaceae bacterium]|nr:hypothetical protein [Candidatus Brocadiaceae bacterium]
PRINDVQAVTVEEKGETTVKVNAGNKIRRITSLGFDAGDQINVKTKNVDNEGNVVVIISNSTQHIVHQVYLDSDMPDVIPICPKGPDVLFSVKTLVGDKDNFGFGSGNVPCDFFNNSGANDVGVFDRELSSGDEVEVWHHTKSSQEIIESVSSRKNVIINLKIRETFSDPGVGSTINVADKLTFQLEADGSDCSGGCECHFGTIHTFTFSKKEVRKALRKHDLKITFTENGDDIGLDYSELVISKVN